MERILGIVTSFYLRSHRFNGLPLSTLSARLQVSADLARDMLPTLVEKKLVSVNTGAVHPNPHIKALDPLPIEQQLDGLKTAPPEHTCIYPETPHLRMVVNSSKYDRQPYALRLALGEPQLRHVAFDLSVLEFYRNDPRYLYEHDDVRGRISLHDKYCRSNGMRRRDKVLLETFGFAYNRRMHRAVASFLWYLSTLTPEHQAIWQAKELRGIYQLHPDYYRSAIIGDWPERVSVFTAFLEEIRVINRMTTAMGRPPLFRNQILPDERPREFGFLIRPTSKEFDDFRQALDKLVSDNLNPLFFRGKINPEEEIARRDGRIEVRHKGTLRMLGEWLRASVRLREPEVLDEMLGAFKAIRQDRNRPAHRIDDNTFDQRYFRQQRKLIVRAYSAMRTLRLIIANHPAVKGVDVPDWLCPSKINIY